MSWRKEQRRAERGYHHGNLKEALLQAALDLIAQKGAAGFTFADAARMAGVSPAAPYRHFRDRDELISSIAQPWKIMSIALRDWAYIGRSF